MTYWVDCQNDMAGQHVMVEEIKLSKLFSSNALDPPSS